MSEQQIEEQEKEQFVDDDPLKDAFPHEKSETGEFDEVPEPPSGDDEQGEVPESEGEKQEVEKEQEPGPEDQKEPQIQPDEINGLKAALKAEREKRQLYEQQLQNMKNQKPQEPKEFDWTDPNKSVDERVRSVEQKLEMKFLELSEYNCKQRHEDYDEKYQVFTEIAMSNPAIINDMLKQPDPAEWAYKQASKQIAMKEIGDDPTAYEQKLRERIKKELLAEMGKEEQELEKKIQQAQKLPPAASKIRGSNPKSESTAFINDPLESVFKGR